MESLGAVPTERAPVLTRSDATSPS